MGLLKNINRPEVSSISFTLQVNLLGYYSGQNFHKPMPVLKAGTWEEAYLNRSKFQFTESGSDSPHGSVFQYGIKAFIPGLFAELSATLSQMVEEQYLLRIVFIDNSWLIIGNEFSGADFTYQQSAELKGAELSWSFQDSKPAQPAGQAIQWDWNQQGQLVQLYQDVNTYTLTDQGVFSGEGPTAKYHKISGTQFVSTNG